MQPGAVDDLRASTSPAAVVTTTLSPFVLDPRHSRRGEHLAVALADALGQPLADLLDS